ncbi:hypothetical protein [Macromonas nakdongensis]|uniref:hypothetical protein n=1 Tax=Macromonas nakdongensis TaxID=1843082 RepID=UPI000C33A8B2|nr:hypothetical protein [Macromonas nakdongensis]
MNARHTPGPWAIEHETDITGSENSPEIGCVGKVDIAHVYLRAVPGKTEANARLIAAAPDLLTALRMVMACAGDISAAPDGLLEMALDDGDEEARRQANAFLVARAAIAKVEGGAA